MDVSCLGRAGEAEMSVSPTIRRETSADQAAIREVHRRSFPSEAEGELVDALREARRLTISLVAEVEGAIVGHVAFSPVTAGETMGLGLAPVAVLPDYRRRGIAAELIRAGLAEAARIGGGYAVVLGEPEYYGRFGFRPAAEWGLHDAYGGGDAFQALSFQPGAIPRGAGLVRYAPEFDRFA